MTSISIAKSAGFCFGVNRALKTLENILDNNETVYTLGPIIHNPQMVSSFEKKGVKIANSLCDVPGNATLVIRSHGVSLEVISEADKRNINIYDATCPFVSKIHDIVYESSQNGDIILIAGDNNHPEVIGIKGHCFSETHVFSNSTELEEIIKSSPYIAKKNLSVVAQTTFSIYEWKKCLKILKKICTCATIFDTICNATSKRQFEAERLSKQSDLMIVIGGKQSSNTAKLKSVCDENCESYLIEDVSELPLDKIKKAKFIGVTAGASTPNNIIREAVKIMQENLEKKDELIENDEMTAKSENDFEKMLEENLKKFTLDSKVSGTVTRITPTEVYVDVGRKQTGFIPADELTYDASANIGDIVKVGDKLDLLIMKTNDQEGTLMLSKKRIDAVKNWKIIVNALKTKEILEGNVEDVIKGGVIVKCNGQRIFVPASLATLSRRGSIEKLKDKNVQFHIVDVNENRKRAVGSIRSVLKEEQDKILDEFWKNIEEGKKYKGKVKSLTSYGAFVDLGGIDGMVHVSELSWDRVTHPSKIVKVGDDIEVYVKSFDKEKGKISLGYKDPTANPWETIKTDFPVGSIVEVEIVGLTSFGAFAKVIPGVDGLIHISQISDRRIEKPNDTLSVGDKVMAVITKIDFDEKRVGLSIRKLIEGDKLIENENNMPDKEPEFSKDDLPEGITLSTEETKDKAFQLQEDTEEYTAE